LGLIIKRLLSHTSRFIQGIRNSSNPCRTHGWSKLPLIV